ncbi:hypothetical protein GJ496_002923 [Pomphorhynchus laevis]|nr:hypothetical protein GJ496_002923 [Pomphorhynchus laevis]
MVNRISTKPCLTKFLTVQFGFVVTSNLEAAVEAAMAFAHGSIEDKSAWQQSSVPISANWLASMRLSKLISTSSILSDVAQDQLPLSVIPCFLSSHVANFDPKLPYRHDLRQRKLPYPHDHGC